MKFLVDECVGSSVGTWLKKEGFTVFSVFDDWRGATDEEILEKCQIEKFILITSDKDFGEMIFRNKQFHNGIILIRCEPNTFVNRIIVLEKLLKNYMSKIGNNFVVVTNDKVRIIEF
jgi:predicted nuclease of predicted toxin-antitoxin system